MEKLSTPKPHFHRAFLLLALILTCALQSRAGDFTYNGLTYTTLTDNTCETKQGNNSTGAGNSVSGDLDLVVPETAYDSDGKAYTVTSIGDYAFYYCFGLTSVTIPNSIISIGSSSFQGCSGLRIVDIPNSVTSIGDYAFYGCTGLTSVTIGNSVSSIGISAFEDCMSMENFIVASNNAYFATNETGVLYNNDFSTLVVCPGGKSEFDIPNSVTSIGDRSFEGCYQLKSVTIPSSVTSIGESAFQNCTRLTSISIPDSVASIGYGAFSGCSRLTSVTIGSSVTSMGKYAFAYCSALTSVIIPNSLTSIAYRTFLRCTGLTSVNLGNSVTSIGEGAFCGCRSLKEVNIPHSVTLIGAEAFYGCTGLTSVNLGNSVTSIENNAFTGCSGLTSITISSSVTSIGSLAFWGCTDITSLTFEDGESELEIVSSAFTNVSPTETYFGRQMDFTVVPCSKLETVEFGEYVKSISDGAFSSATSLRSITAHGTVPPTIYESTFATATYNLGTLHVKKDAINDYKTADGWKNFCNVAAYDITDGINEVGNDNNTVNDTHVSVADGAICVDEDSDVCIVAMNGTTIYNGRGNISINVAPGIYVVVVNDIATKVAVK